MVIPAQAGDSDTIVWQVSHGTVRDPAVAARMSAMLRQVATMPEVAAVASPYGPRGAAQVSRDGRTAYATVDFAKEANDLAKADVTRVIDAAQAARAPGLNVQLGGQAIESTEQAPLSASTAIGLMAAAVVLFIAFGSALAMLLPLVTAIAGVGDGPGADSGDVAASTRSAVEHEIRRVGVRLGGLAIQVVDTIERLGGAAKECLVGAV